MLEINVERKGQRALLRVRGSLAGPDSRLFQRSIDGLLDELPRLVVVDLEGVEQINSACLSTLLRLQGELEERRGRCRLVNLHPALRQILELTQMDELFELRN